jgi:hypothetical protein
MKIVGKISTTSPATPAAVNFISCHPAATIAFTTERVLARTGDETLVEAGVNLMLGPPPLGKELKGPLMKNLSTRRAFDGMVAPANGPSMTKVTLEGLRLLSSPTTKDMAA